VTVGDRWQNTAGNASLNIPDLLLKRRPRRYSRNGASETSQVPGGPTRQPCPALRPRGASAPRLTMRTLLPSTLKTVSASETHSFRGSITRPGDSLCTLRRQARACTTPHSVPAGCSPLPGRTCTCRVPQRSARSSHPLHDLPPPGLPWRTFKRIGHFETVAPMP
jgi:hypothetical protein